MKCKVCGFHKRGKNHDSGHHHRVGKFGHTSQKNIEKVTK